MWMPSFSTISKPGTHVANCGFWKKTCCQLPGSSAITVNSVSRISSTASPFSWRAACTCPFYELGVLCAPLNEGKSVTVWVYQRRKSIWSYENIYCIEKYKKNIYIYVLYMWSYIHWNFEHFNLNSMYSLMRSERECHASLESVQSLVAKTEHLGHCKSKAGCGYRMSEMLIQSHWHDLRFITLHKCWLRPKSFLRARGCSRWFEHRI